MSRRLRSVQPDPIDGHWWGRWFHRLNGHYYRRRLYEMAGSDRYSKPALHGVDVQVAALLGEGGYFVEAGANDGYAQSNTYHLERQHGWRGVLVEPIPMLAERCAVERPRSRVFQCALVAPEASGSTVEMRYGYLMSIVEGSRGDAANDDEHIANAQEWMGVKDAYRVAVPARTLTEVLAEAGAPRDIDFLSLDIEGFELEALKGLDTARFAPRYMLIEIWDRTGAMGGIDAHLAGDYEPVGWLTPGDRLYRRSDQADSLRLPQT